MTITIFILFVLYTLGCIADGPDVKPKWKKWLGKRLEVMSNALYPIQYVKRHMSDIDNPFVKQPIQVTSSDTRLIQIDFVFKTHDFVKSDDMIAQIREYIITERQAQFAKSLKQGINDMLIQIGRIAYQKGLVDLELMIDNCDFIVLHGEMRIVEPERPFYKKPYILFENSKIELRKPNSFIDMGLINKEQIQF